MNGARDVDFHPALPLTAEAMARDGAACIAAGASELHLHVRGSDGREESNGACHERHGAGAAPCMSWHAHWRVYRRVDRAR